MSRAQNQAGWTAATRCWILTDPEGLGAPQPSPLNAPQGPVFPGGLPAHLSHPLPRPAVVTLHPYTAQKDNELSFSEGTVMYVTRRYSDGWCEGVSSEGAGFFPGNYVEPSC